MKSSSRHQGDSCQSRGEDWVEIFTSNLSEKNNKALTDDANDDTLPAVVGSW